MDEDSQEVIGKLIQKTPRQRDFVPKDQEKNEKKNNKSKDDEQDIDMLTLDPMIEVRFVGVILPDPIILTEEDLLKLVQDTISAKVNKNEGLTVTCYGRRRTGKSFFLRNLMYLLRDRWPFGMLFSVSAFTGFWLKHTPTKFAVTEFELFEEKAKKLIGYQKLMTLALAKFPSLWKLLNPRKYAILDDVIHDQRIRFSPSMDQISSTGRHLNIDIFATTQNAKGLNKCWRNNTDFPVVFQQHSLEQIDGLFEAHGNFLDRKQFHKLLLQYTQDNHCVIFNSSCKSHNFYDYVFVYKAKDPGDFILGCKEFWECGSGLSGEETEVLEALSHFNPFTGERAPYS
jgi:hypothetical protein